MDTQFLLYMKEHFDVTKLTDVPLNIEIMKIKKGISVTFIFNYGTRCFRINKRKLNFKSVGLN